MPGGEREKIQSEVRHNGLISILEIDRRTISADQKPFLKATFTVRNTGPTAVAFTFSTTQQYDFLILDERGREYWRWSKGRFFAMMVMEKQLGREPWVYSVAVPVTQEDGRRFPPGRYILRVRLTAQPPLENEIGFRVE